MKKISLIKFQEQFSLLLDVNDFENSIIFLETFVSQTKEEWGTKYLKDSQSFPAQSNNTSVKNAILSISPSDFAFLPNRDHYIEIMVVISKYFKKLKEHIEKYDFSDSSNKNLYFTCFKILHEIYLPYQEYFDLIEPRIIRKSEIIKCYFNFYCLSKGYYIVDENHEEFLKLKKMDQIISEKYSNYEENLDLDPLADYSFIYSDEFHNSLTERERNFRKLMTYSENHKVNFHPYNGKQVNEIINENPKQFLDLIINLDHFSVFEAVLMNHCLIEQDNFLNAFIKNRVKRIYQIKEDQEWKEIVDREERLDREFRDSENKS